MFGIQDFGVFLATGIVLNLTPGPDSLYIFGRSMAHGRGAGVASALGVGAGSIVHTIAAAVGLSTLIAASATAFLAVKYAGAAYLVFLGVKMLFSQAPVAAAPSSFTSSSSAAAFRQGMVTNVLNPKVALFYLAFLPQFIAADSSSKFAAFLTLGLAFVATGTAWCLCIAWFSSLLGNRFRSDATVAKLLNRAAGALFVGLGVRLATSD